MDSVKLRVEFRFLYFWEKTQIQSYKLFFVFLGEDTDTKLQTLFCVSGRRHRYKVTNLAHMHE